MLQAGRVLSEKWQADNLLITLGEQGVLLFRHEAAPYHAPTRAQKVFDVSGAGDTVIALFTLALSAGATPPEAAEIANHASGVVVGKLGTATASPAKSCSRASRADREQKVPCEVRAIYRRFALARSAAGASVRNVVRCHRRKQFGHRGSAANQSGDKSRALHNAGAPSQTHSTGDLAT